MKLTPENIEEQILLLVDGELEESAEEGVIAYLEEHPQYKTMLDAYLATQLQPDEGIIFPGKESLLREEPAVAKVIRFAVWQKAAAVALILVAGVAATLLLQREEPGRDVPVVAQEAVPSATIKPTDTSRTSNAVAVVAPQPNKSQKSLQQNNPVPRTIAPQKQEAAIAVAPDIRKEETITPLVTAPEMAIAVEHTPAAGAMIAKTEVTPAARPDEDNPKAWSPIKAETREGIHDLVAHFQIIKEQVQEKTQLLKAAANTIVFRFGDKEVALNK